MREVERVGSAPLIDWAGQQEGAAVSLFPASEAAGGLAAYPESTDPESGGRYLPATPPGRPVQTAPTSGEMTA